MFEALLAPLIRKRQQKNFLYRLWEEIAGNYEKYCIIDQRQFISTSFDCNAWKEAKHFSMIDFPMDVLNYTEAVEAFNKNFADMKAYEEFYCSSIDNKTFENAQVLHTKKEGLEITFKQLQPKILAAQNALRPLLEKKSNA